MIDREQARASRQCRIEWDAWTAVHPDSELPLGMLIESLKAIEEERECAIPAWAGLKLLKAVWGDVIR